MIARKVDLAKPLSRNGCNTFKTVVSLTLAFAFIDPLSGSPSKAAAGDISRQSSVLYKTIIVDGLSIFYREAGPVGVPTLLLLHSFPSSSRMYEPLLNRLSDRFHLVAPADFPGFGHSDAPAANGFAYTFDHMTTLMLQFTDAIGLKRYSLYLQDCGARPVRPVRSWRCGLDLRASGSDQG